jgi:hypothetical protein
MHKNMLDLIRLLDPYAHSHAIDRRLDEDSLFLITGDCERVEEDFGRGGCFDFGHIVAL